MILFYNSGDRGFFCLAGANDPRPSGANWDYDEDGLILSNTTVCNTDVSCAGPCPPGHYCPDQGTLQPLPCPLNKYLNSNRFIDPLNTFVGGATDESQCAGCPAGMWCQPGVSEPISCPVGFYCEANSQPKPCPASTFRNEVGARNEGDCASCDAGFYCTNLGMKDQENFQCKPGFYCPGGDNLPIKCPEGTYRNETGGKCGDRDDCRRQSNWRNRLDYETDGCLPCTEGYYCPEQSERGDVSNDHGLPCPPGANCPEGSTTRSEPCPAGYYCPETSFYEEFPCYAGNYCSEGSANMTICEFPYYCPPMTGDPLTCDLGSGAIESNDCRNRTTEEFCCQECPSGQYRDDPLMSECENCPVGYYCPAGTGADGTRPIICPAGHYCPEGNPEGKPRPCEPGSFSTEEGLSQNQCTPCPENTYNHLYGQQSCRPCGPSSFANPGSSKCTCEGTNRAFQYSDGTCICQNGFVYYSLAEADESSLNDGADCLEIVNEDCVSGQVRDALTRACEDPNNLTVECPNSICLDSDVYYNTDYGTCLCTGRFSNSSTLIGSRKRHLVRTYLKTFLSQYSSGTDRRMLP